MNRRHAMAYGILALEIIALLIMAYLVFGGYLV
jgi:hypothetical protein